MFVLFNEGNKYVFGGYAKDDKIRMESTSGGAFSVIVNAFYNNFGNGNCVIFGAQAEGIEVFHSYITDIKDLSKFRKSKYSQSKMGDCYKECREFLSEGKNVLFSGTPCQIAGLKTYLNASNAIVDKLLTVEVVCEGVPSPLYIRKYENSLKKKFGSKIETIDYRYTGKSIFNAGKWDFEIMRTKLYDRKKAITKDRWFNPFWSIWLNHLMSRPVCYECPFARQERAADITLGDLWGVHLYCPELYGKNKGASLVFVNSDKGMSIVKQAEKMMYGHKLEFEDAIKYQGPMRRTIARNEKREACLSDLRSNMTYKEINDKWAKKSSFKLLWNKYMWGNRQKVWLWKITRGKYKIK